MIDVVRADELGEGYRRRITEVLVHGFAEDFSYFSSDPVKLADVFEHMVLLERFYVALMDGEPAGVASLTGGEQQCFAPRWREIRRHLGLIHGTITYGVIRSQFMGVYDGAEEGLAEIGFVATSPVHQGRGVATALLKHLLGLQQYRVYVLEAIKDTNAPALGLYRKLGFAVYRRRAVRFADRAGFTEYVSMRLDQA
jgi:ribosomal protein S18 acetylase RimI-like enzyme